MPWLISMNLPYSAEKTRGGGWPKFTKRKCPPGRISPYSMVAISRELSFGFRPKALRAVTGLRQSEIDFLEELWGRFSVPIEFRKHEGMKSIVNGRSNLRRDDAVPLGIHQ